MFHNVSKAEVLKQLKTDIKTGLKEENVLKLREEYGFNKLNEKKKKTFLQKLYN